VKPIVFALVMEHIEWSCNTCDPKGTKIPRLNATELNQIFLSNYTVDIHNSCDKCYDIIISFLNNYNIRRLSFHDKIRLTNYDYVFKYGVFNVKDSRIYMNNETSALVPISEEYFKIMIKAGSIIKYTTCNDNDNVYFERIKQIIINNNFDIKVDRYNNYCFSVIDSPFVMIKRALK